MVKARFKIGTIIILLAVCLIRWIVFGVELNKTAKSKWHTLMSATYFSRGDEERGVLMLEEALKGRFVYPEAYLKYGIFLLNKEQPYSALPYLEKAYLFLPWKIAIYKALADAYSMIGLGEKALDYGRIYVNSNPTFENRLWFAMIMVKARMFEDAFFLVKDLKQEQPENPLVLTIYGIILLNMGKEEDAIFWWDKALSLTKDKENLKRALKSIIPSLSDNVKVKVMELLNK